MRCAIGVTAIDLYIKTLQFLGSEVTIDKGFIKTLKGCEVAFPIETELVV